MKRIFGPSVLAVVLAGAGCGGGGGGADLEAFVKLDTAKGEAFAVGGDDCVAKAKSVRAWRTAHNAEYKAAQAKLKAQYPKGPPKEAMDKHGAQLTANKKAVVGAMMKCTNTPEFDAAIDDTK